MKKSNLIKTIKAAQGGDESAVSRLYTEYAGYVYRLAFKLTGSKEEAEDVMQNVFILVLKKINQLRKPDAFEGWLKKITINSSFTIIKKRISIVDDEDIFGMQEETQAHALPESALDGKETLRIIGATVDALPAVQRICVYYHFYQGLTAPKIAEIIGENINTVKSRILRAKKKIRSELKRIEKEEGIKLRGVTFLPITSALKLSVESVEVPTGIIESVWGEITAASVETIATGTTTAIVAGSVGLNLGALIGSLVLTTVVGVGIYFGYDWLRESIIIEKNIDIDLSAYDLLGYEIEDDGDIVLSVDFDDPYVFDPDKFRELFFGTWEHDGEVTRIDDSEDIDINHWFVSGEIASKNVKGEVYYTLLIIGGVPTVFWIDVNEPDVMYVKEEFYVGNINSAIDYYETWTRTSSSVTEPAEDFYNDMRLKEFAIERGIDPDMLIEIDTDWGVRNGTENAGWCFPSYLISEEDEKIEIKTYVRESLEYEEVVITYTLQKIDGEWVQTLYRPMPTTNEGIFVLDYATEENINKYSAVNEYVEFREDGYQKIIIAVKTTVSDFRYIGTSMYDDGQDFFYYETDVLYSLDELTPEKPFVVTWMPIGGVVANRGISFVDMNGERRYYYLGYHGDDGSLLLTEFIPKPYNE